MVRVEGRVRDIGRAVSEGKRKWDMGRYEIWGGMGYGKVWDMGRYGIWGGMGYGKSGERRKTKGAGDRMRVEAIVMYKGT